jgi:hypothetical protein
MLVANSSINTTFEISQSNDIIKRSMTTLPFALENQVTLFEISIFPRLKIGGARRSNSSKFSGRLSGAEGSRKPLGFFNLV